jgi:hypothetical protein
MSRWASRSRRTPLSRSPASAASPAFPDEARQAFPGFAESLYELQLFGNQRLVYAASLQGALNRIATDGWRFAESHKEPSSGAVYFIFEREPPQELHEDFRNGIQAVRPSM